ncbi:21686_t:CDS:2, partial [Entrophospora sp. SA101]
DGISEIPGEILLLLPGSLRPEQDISLMAQLIAMNGGGSKEKVVSIKIPSA